MKFTFSKSQIQLYLVGLLVLVSAVMLVILFAVDSSSGKPDQTTVTMLTVADCENCFDLAPLVDYLKENGVEANYVDVEYDSRQGKKMIEAYGVTGVPTVIIEGYQVDAIEPVKNLVDLFGQMKSGAFVVTNLQPPYLSLVDKQIKGLFEVVYLDDSSCEECYDVTDHRMVFDRLAMKPAKETTIEINSDEGQAIIEDYVITAVPTIILRGDLGVYSQLQEIWEQVGTKEEDGSYVLRRGIEDMGSYKRIPSGEIITVDQIQN